MKIDKDTAKCIWCIYGKPIVGGLLCIAGFIMANQGSVYKGRMKLGFEMFKADPERFDKLAEKLRH